MRRQLRQLTLVGAALLAGSAWGASATPAALPELRSILQTGFALKAAVVEDRVQFHGSLEDDGSGGHSSSMLYQMPAGAGVGGLLAAILTHGAISEGARKASMAKALNAADQVLTPYQDVLQKLSQQELMKAALDSLSDSVERQMAQADAPVTSAWLIESEPIFLLTQDQRAIVLEHNVVIRNVARPDFVFQTTVRVVSDPIAADEARETWLRDDGQALRQASTRLYAHSLHVLLQQLGRAPAADAQPRFKTFRFSEGGARKFERAQLLSLACARAVVRTLRGTLLSIPQAASEVESAVADDGVEAPKDCAEAVQPYPS